MKYLILSCIVCMLSCQSQPQQTENDTDPNMLSTDLIKDGESLVQKDMLDYAAITLETNRWKFGQINQGDIVEQTFHFQNTGKNPLIISSAVGSCGCTVPTYPKEPIAPGEKGEIHVKFTSGSRLGKQSKQVKITANTKPNVTELFVEGEILEN